MSVIDMPEFDAWRNDALWAVTKSDVDCLCEERGLTPEQMERIYHRVAGMDASLVMEQVLDLIDWEIADMEKEKEDEQEV